MNQQTKDFNSKVQQSFINSKAEATDNHKS